MSAEEEIRKVFQAWSKETQAKDIDGLMSHIADDVVSYEHDAPLQYIGVDKVREVCQNGFNSVEGEFGLDFPDLKIMVRDDIAVTWGLNHMQVQEPSGKKIDNWSRGTRIFQKIDDEWKVIHQHVSFPYDPESGEAKIDLTP